MTVARCSFSNNESGVNGGALRSDSYSFVTVVECMFQNNWSRYSGGALHSSDSSSTEIANSVFCGNTAQSGGAIICGFGSSTLLTNCTFWGNSADWGGAAYVSDSNFTAANCVLWGNSAVEGREISGGPGGTIDVTYSVVQGGYAGDGNIDADPLFVNAGADDLHLQAGSPCIDAADGDAAPEFDIDGNARIDDPATPDTGVGTPPYADMGAYEYQP